MSEEQKDKRRSRRVTKTQSTIVTGFHPVAGLFPLMDERSFRELLADIEAHGQLAPIWLHKGQIIDGRNRYRACMELGIEPLLVEWDQRGDLVDMVVGLNLKRRHLTTTQRAVVAFRMLPVLEAEAKARQVRKPAATAPEILPGQKADARDQAAAMVGVSGRYVSEVKRIAAEAPEKLKALEAGTLTLQGAKRQIAKERDLMREGEPVRMEPLVMEVAGEAIAKLMTIEGDGPQVLMAMDRVLAYIEGRIRQASASPMKDKAAGGDIVESQLFLFKE